jgi:hypothetical protein
LRLEERRGKKNVNETDFEIQRRKSIFEIQRTKLGPIWILDFKLERGIPG